MKLQTVCSLFITLTISACASQSHSWMHKAKHASFFGENVEAITYASKAIKYKPDYAEAYLHRGKAYLKIGAEAKSIHDFNKALELKPQFFQRYLAMQGIDFPATKGLATSTKAKIIYFSKKAKMAAKNNDFRNVISNYTELVDFNSTLKPIFTLRRGKIYQKLGNCSLANQDFQSSCNQGLTEACMNKCN